MTFMGHHPRPVLAAAACVAILACSSGPSRPPSTTLNAGGYSLVFSGGGRSIALERGGTTLLTFPADAFELGVVDSLDDQDSYDPFWLE